ncbi:Uncharacterised protein [uncultured archaeon]|nr:Uncharacterised protein [uncultured archaeon]
MPVTTQSPIQFLKSKSKSVHSTIAVTSSVLGRVIVALSISIGSAAKVSVVRTVLEIQLNKALISVELTPLM